MPRPRALAEDLEHWLADEPVAAYREGWGPRLARWGRHHRPIVAGLAALLVTAVVALSVSTVLIGHETARKEEQRRLAELNFTRARNAVDQMLTEVAEVELADVPQMQPVRKRLLEKAQRFYLKFLEQKRDDPSVRRETARRTSGSAKSRRCWGATRARSRRIVAGSKSFRPSWISPPAGTTLGATWHAASTIWACS